MTGLLGQDAALQVFAGAAAGLVLLYLIRPRAVRVVLPSLALWRQELGRRRDPRWRERLALLLQLAAAAVIVRSLVDLPQVVEEDPVDEEPAIVAVIDASGSMRASGRLDAAVEQARALGGGLVVAGEQVSFLSEPGAGDLERGLAQVEIGPGRADLAAAVATIQSRGQRPVVLSDHPVAGGLVVGPAGRDLAVLEVSAVASEGLPPRLQVAVRLAAHAEDDQEARLEIWADGERLGARDTVLTPEAERVERFSLEPLEAAAVEARLADNDDALADNDRAWGLVPELRPARVELVGPGNRYLEGVLAALPGLEVRRSAPGAWRLPSWPVDLVIFDRCGPIRTLDLPSVYVDPPEGLGPFPTTAAVQDPTFQRWDYSHPVLKGVSLRHLSVEAARPLEVPEGARVLAAIAEGPVVAVSDDLPRQLVIGFDLTRSDLPLSVAFPQLIYNLLLWAREDAAGDPALRGRTATEGLDLAGLSGVEVTSLSTGERWAPSAALARHTGLEPGLYRVEHDGGSELVALNWDPEEHARADEGGALVTEPPPEEEPEEPTVPRTWWAVLAFGLLFVEFGVAPR